MLNNQNNKQSENIEPEIDFHQAAIVNEIGEEIAITEDMVRNAIHELDDDAYPEAQIQSESETQSKFQN